MLLEFDKCQNRIGFKESFKEELLLNFKESSRAPY